MELEQRVKERTQELEDVHAQLLKKALYDELTALPNRVLFIRHLELTIKQLQDCPNYLFAVLFLDCDRFKVINDSLGHSVGDQLLVAIAQRLQSIVSNIDILSRFGGDEFAILLRDLTEPEIAIQTARKLLKFWLNRFLFSPIPFILMPVLELLIVNRTIPNRNKFYAMWIRRCIGQNHEAFPIIKFLIPVCIKMPYLFYSLMWIYARQLKKNNSE